MDVGELDYKKSWVLKNWCFWTVVLEKTLESPLDCKEIQPVHPKGNQSWIFIGRIDVEAETPILWSPDVKNWIIWKDPDSGKDWRWEEKDQQRMRWLNGITDSMDMSLSNSRSWWQRARSGVLQFMGLQRVGHNWVTELIKVCKWSIWCSLGAASTTASRKWYYRQKYRSVYWRRGKV